MFERKYVVYITHYKGDKLPTWYIGSSYEEKVLKGYNGSVKSKKYKEIYKLEQKENKHLFKTRILSYHNSQTEAIIEELRLQKKHKVVKNEKYFNMSYASINGFFGRDVSGENHPMYGRNHSKESMEKMIETSRNDIDENGDNLLVRKAKKAAKTLGKEGIRLKTEKSKQTCKNIILDNGLTIDEQRIKKFVETYKNKSTEEKNSIKSKISCSLKNKSKLECMHCSKTISAVGDSHTKHEKNCRRKDILNRGIIYKFKLNEDIYNTIKERLNMYNVKYIIKKHKGEKLTIINELDSTFIQLMFKGIKIE